jgi:hypothetical protein
MKTKQKTVETKKRRMPTEYYVVLIAGLAIILLATVMHSGLFSMGNETLINIRKPSQAPVSSLYLPTFVNHLMTVKGLNFSSIGTSFSITNTGNMPIKIENMTVEFSDGNVMIGNVAPDCYKLVQGETKEYAVPEIVCELGQEYNISKLTISYVIIENPRDMKISNYTVTDPITGLCQG